MNLRRERFVFAPAVRRVDAGHRQLGQTPPLQRALAHHGYGGCGCRGAVTGQEVAREVEDVPSVDGPLALQDSLADVVQPVDHHAVLDVKEGRVCLLGGF